MSDPGGVTLASYETAAQRYRERSVEPSPALVAFLDQLSALVGVGHILEIGSGPGREAAYIEARGPRVTRTDGARAFVEMMRADGHEAELLDVRTGEIDLRFVVGYSPLEFRDTLHLLADGKVDASPLITDTIGLDVVASAFDALRDPEQHAKIVIDPRRTNRE